jgi:hypothetical protein
MKWIAATVLTLGLVGAGLVDQAHAGTQRQFNLIETGWTKYHTENVIEDQGTKVGQYTGSAGNPHIVKYYIIEDTGHGWWIDYRKADEYYRVYDQWGDQA